MVNSCTVCGRQDCARVSENSTDGERIKSAFMCHMPDSYSALGIICKGFCLKRSPFMLIFFFLHCDRPPWTVFPSSNEIHTAFLG